MSAFKNTLIFLTAAVGVAGWVIALVCLSKVQDDCGNSDRCESHYRRYWWSLMYEVGVAAAFLILLVIRKADEGRAGIIGLMAVATTQVIEIAGKFFDKVDNFDISSIQDFDLGSNDDVNRGALAGYAILAGANMFFMFLYGIVDSK